MIRSTQESSEDVSTHTSCTKSMRLSKTTLVPEAGQPVMVETPMEYDIMIEERKKGVRIYMFILNKTGSAIPRRVLNANKGRANHMFISRMEGGNKASLI